MTYIFNIEKCNLFKMICGKAREEPRLSVAMRQAFSLVQPTHIRYRGIMDQANEKVSKNHQADGGDNRRNTSSRSYQRLYKGKSTEKCVN
uniref:Uncharacterized protein n=1 Tax=Heterorhabditis bacteriophora TaxID=37862 RepID=A0A1I7XMK8_HETBA